MPVVESFTLDHTKVKAPYVRVAGVERHALGSVVQKFDLRLLQPNTDAIPTAALHTLEHLLAFGLREELDGIIDISPMGCRTGFYLILWDEHKPADVAAALTRVLRRVLDATDVPAVTPLPAATIVTIRFSRRRSTQNRCLTPGSAMTRSGVTNHDCPRL